MEGPLYEDQHLHPDSLFHSPSQQALVPQHLTLDPTFTFQFGTPLDSAGALHNLHPRAFFDPPPQSSFTPLQLQAAQVPPRPHPSSHGVGFGHVGVLQPQPAPSEQPRQISDAVNHRRTSLDIRPNPETRNEISKGHFPNLKYVPHPPNLDAWRERLFDLVEPIILTEEEFNTYFPHIDNVYSHRSSQQYKRKPFVSHYFDCRLKGRPPGTKPSDDPSKQKRKRKARERDLCEVKVKVTEYHPGARQSLGNELAQHESAALSIAQPHTINGPDGVAQSDSQSQPLSMLDPQLSTVRPDPPGSDGGRFYTIQRVNGNGLNGKGDGTTAIHQHTLEESDRIKKSTVHRYFLKEEKDNRKLQGHEGPGIHTGVFTGTMERLSLTPVLIEAARPGSCIWLYNSAIISELPIRCDHTSQVADDLTFTNALFETGLRCLILESRLPYCYSLLNRIMSNGAASEQKTYHRKATGPALATVKRRSKDHELKLFGSCFCPFVQRVWISLELKHLDYQYIEIDPYHKTESFLQLNPRGLVPALRHDDWTCYESTVLMEYLEDLNTGPALLPPNPRSRAHSRLWSDHINRHIVPKFYHYLQAQETEEQTTNATALSDEIKKLIDAADPAGPFFLGPTISFVDVQIAPWVLRMGRVLKPYRGWPEPEEGSRWKKWVDAIENDEAVKATTSGDELYKDSYERYAQNRPDTSQVANAVNEGRGLP